MLHTRLRRRCHSDLHQSVASIRMWGSAQDFPRANVRTAGKDDVHDRFFVFQKSVRTVFRGSHGRKCEITFAMATVLPYPLILLASYPPILIHNASVGLLAGFGNVRKWHGDWVSRAPNQPMAFRESSDLAKWAAPARPGLLVRDTRSKFQGLA